MPERAAPIRARRLVTQPEIHAGAPLERFERDTLTKLFFGGVDRFASREALREKRRGEWRSLTYAETSERVLALASQLAAWGVGRGDRVALLSENRPEWAIVDYAALLVGAATVPLYPSLPAEPIGAILRHAEPKAIFASTPGQIAKIAHVRDQLSPALRVIGFDAQPEGGEQLPALLEAAPPLEPAEREAIREAALAISPGDVATLIYTSGTTGAPKGVMLTHGNLATMIAATRQHGSIPVEPGDIALSLLPLSHVFERAADYYYWDSGVAIVYAESFERVAANLEEVRPHVMLAVPRFFEKVHARAMEATGIRQTLLEWAVRVGGRYVDARLGGRRVPAAVALQYRLADRLVFSKLRERTGGRVRVFISGGAPLSAEVARFFFAAGLPVYEGYGLTETSPVLTANRPGQTRLGTVGVLYPGIELKLGEQGEILARAPTITPGYWKDPEATARAFDAEGWFHTGDVGRFDADGFLSITDRLKDLIVTAGGKNITPQPLELEATRSPYIAQAVLIGDRRPYPVLLVVPDFDAVARWAREQGLDLPDHAALAHDPRVQELVRSAALGGLGGFARFERPKKLSVLSEEMTIEGGLLTPTLKVRRRAVEARYRELIEALYAG
jgi:long-chain acyl-CoA synthetase